MKIYVRLSIFLATLLLLIISSNNSVFATNCTSITDSQQSVHTPQNVDGTESHALQVVQSSQTMLLVHIPQDVIGKTLCVKQPPQQPPPQIQVKKNSQKMWVSLTILFQIEMGLLVD